MTSQDHQKTSKIISNCQSCDATDLQSVLFLGYLPPVNQMPSVTETPHEQLSYPTQLLHCAQCELVQLGIIVNPEIIFPFEYPYTSSTTKVLRENFAELFRETQELLNVGKEELVIDIGSNDGNLLSNFKDHHKVLGITPEKIGNIAIERGIPTIIDYFNKPTVDKVLSEHGKAKLITATNVFAHIDNVNTIVKLIESLLDKNGVFACEVHYLVDLLKTIQYDTIYHEHMRYYSVTSLKNLFERHDLEIFHAKRIPSHGGSVRVYVARKGDYEIKDTVNALLEEEGQIPFSKRLADFSHRVTLSKLQLHALLLDLKKNNKRVYGVGAPSRASTLVNYVGLDHELVECVLEIQGSHKINKYMPGTLIPVVDEQRMIDDSPDALLMLSWHIADELAPKLRAKGFKGQFIVPLPEPKILDL